LGIFPQPVFSYRRQRGRKAVRYEDARIEGVRRLEQAGIEEAENNGKELLFYCCDFTATAYLLHKMEEMPEEKVGEYFALIEKRQEHIPLQHLTGECYFMGYPMKVTPDVLVPRFDTEILVEEVLKLKAQFQAPRVLDMCTGSGCIIVSLKKLWREIEATGSDVSEKALLVAKENGLRNGAEVCFVHSDLFENISGKFDVIVSNPPYIRTDVIEGLAKEVKEHDPMLALDGKEDGLFFYRRIIAQGQNHLECGGYLCFEIGHDQAKDVSRLLADAGYEGIYVKKDLVGLDRVVVARKG